MASDISAIILTFNEELHIKRCISSLHDAGIKVFVVDSGSTDKTLDIVRDMGVTVFHNQWVNYASQFQWGLENCPIDTKWIMRMDADEYLEQDLIEELALGLSMFKDKFTGFYIRRKYFFLGRWIKYGAVYPLNLLRIWRVGSGKIESRWMDEHIVLSEQNAETKFLSGHIVDDNLNNTRWYIDKHNKYADREMIDIIMKKYHLADHDQSISNDTTNFQARIKRLLKENCYNHLPIFVRPILYFLYRYILRAGFLDGTRGFAFHFMQGLWYRSLVDLRVYEAEKHLSVTKNREEQIQILRELTGLDL